MTNEEIYEFDLRGYIVFREVLSPAEVGRLREILRRVQVAGGSGKFAFMELDPIFIELMAQPFILEKLRVMLGDWLRFDHAIGIQMTSSERIVENLHGGLLQEGRSFWYQWVPEEGMHNGLIKVSYALNDVNPGDGGFICVPGSHKGNMYHRLRPDSHLVVNPQLKSGDCLIFTEALVHGSQQWTAEQTRQVLIYSYAPGCLAWKNYETIKPYLALATTDLQRDLLRAPFFGDYDEHESKRTGVWPLGRRPRNGFAS
ncbi:MAG TPA: phytanoyl-CoA dioxygenase family protein [Blastocatellia bacterium]|nr:phytanoyl-CoA dioxygenase family protein [Blastocatellia bacterium]